MNETQEQGPIAPETITESEPCWLEDLRREYDHGIITREEFIEEYRAMIED